MIADETYPVRVCKEDCVNPLEWKRRMEGKEDEI